MTPPAEHANTPAWQHSPEWREIVSGIPHGHEWVRPFCDQASKAAVAADRAHLATQIENLVLTWDYDKAAYQQAIADVLAVLRDAP